jgi:inositol phosphorylceramide mannosyltransferase catalytic subunit
MNSIIQRTGNLVSTAAPGPANSCPVKSFPEGGEFVCSRIPKRIIQTGKSLDLPLFAKAAVANVRLLNPDFEYLFFDDKQVEEIIDEKFPEYRSIFDSFRFPISRYDFFRYLAIYHFGGFYLDLDVFLACSLESLIDFGCVFSFEELNANFFLRQEYGMDWGIGNYAFGAAAGHPFIHAIIKNCVRVQEDPQWAQAMMRSIPRMFRREYYVLNTTGPGLVARTLAEYPEAAKHVKVLFPENVCDPGNWSRFGTFGIHLMKGTWRKGKGIFRNRLYTVWMAWTEKKLFKESLKLGKSRSLEFKRKA